MKTPSSIHVLLQTAACVALLAFPLAAQAADVIKANNETNLDQTASWSGTVPGTGDVGVWDDTVTGTNATVLGSDLSWQGLRIGGTTETGTVTIAAGNALTLGTSGIDLSAAPRDLTLNSGIVIGGNQNWNVAADRTLAINSSPGNLLSGSANFTKTGGGVLRTNAPTGSPNDFSGIFTLEAGTWLNFGQFLADSSTAQIVLKGGTRVENGGAAVSTVTSTSNAASVTHLDGNVTFVGTTSTTSSSSRLVFGGSEGGSAAVNLRADVEVNIENAPTSGGGGYVSFAGISEDTPGRTLTKTGLGTLQIDGKSLTNTWAGNLIINEGILRVQTYGELPTNGNVTVNGGTLLLNTFNNLTLNTLTLTSGAIEQGTLSPTKTLSASSFVMSAGSVGQILSGTGAMTKGTGGTVTFSAANTYSGATTVNAGTLLIQGAQSGSGLVTVESTGALGGNGSIAGSLSLLAGADFVFSLTDTFTVDGTSVSFGGFSISDLIGLDSSVALGTYILIDGSAAFNFDNVSNFGSGNAASIGDGKSAYFQSGSLEVVVVPEPGTLGMIFLAMAAFCILPRKRQRP